MVTTIADLNLHPDLNGNVKIFCSQYDNALREIVFTIYDGDDLADLTDLTAKVEGTKPDKYGYSYDATISTSNSTVTVTLVTQMTCVAGLSHAEIVLYSGDSRVGTANFLLMVEEAGISDDTIVSDSVIPGIHNIDTLVEYAQTYADNAEASALEAEGYAAGTQNGTEVESGSEYYEHNAKYYCEQAWRATPEGYADLVQQVETNTTNIATNATDISNVLNMLCDEWSSTVYYRAGDWLHYNGVLYKVNIGAQTAFAAVVPPNAAYYDVKTITEALEELRSIIANTYADFQTYTAGQIITFQGKLYKVIVDCTGITPPNTSYYTATTVAELIAENATDISTLNSSLTNNFSVTSNENLVDNAWFTVNQRGASSYTGTSSMYSVDRWQLNTSTAVVTVIDEGITVYNSGSGTTNVHERLKANLFGKQITISAIINNTLYQATATVPSTLSAVWTDVVKYTGDNFYFKLEYTPYSDWQFTISINTGETISVRAVKLEVGSVSTLANDTIPDYAIELAKCRASTADSTDTYANQGQIVMDSSLTNLSGLVNTYTFSSDNPLVLQVSSSGAYNYATFIIMGFFQGLGSRMLALKVNAGAITDIVNLISFSAFSSSVLSFSYDASVGQLTVTTTFSGDSIVTVIKN